MEGKRFDDTRCKSCKYGVESVGKVSCTLQSETSQVEHSAESEECEVWLEEKRIEFVEGVVAKAREISASGEEVMLYNIDGLCRARIEDLVQQPIEGLLYDLNSLEEVILATNRNNLAWVNHYAMIKVFRWLFKKYEESFNTNNSNK